MTLTLEEQKAWYSRNFDRLRESLYVDGNLRQDTVQHLRSDTFEDVILSFTQGYDDHVVKFTRECIANGDPAMVWSFLTAQYDIYMRFGFGPFGAMARKINGHILRTNCSIRASPTPQIVPPLPSPCSGPPTPCTVDEWLDEVGIEMESHITQGDPPTPLPRDEMRVESQILASFGTSTQMVAETRPAQHLDDVPRGPKSVEILDTVVPKAAVLPHSHRRAAKTRDKRAQRASSVAQDRREGRVGTVTTSKTTSARLRRSKRLRPEDDALACGVESVNKHARIS